MKIAFFTETYLPNIDGVVTSILSMRAELEARGHEVFIFTVGDKRAKGRNNDPKVKYFSSVPFPPYPSYRLAILPRGVREVLEKEDVDVIHTHGMGTMGIYAVYCAKMLGKPLIGTMHTNIQEATHYVSNFKPVQRILKRIAWRYLRTYFNSCDAVIAPSDYMARECRKHGIKKVVAIPNGVDLGYFKPAGKRTRWKKNEVVLFVGRLVREKNLDVLIRSAPIVSKRIKNVRYVIVGGGPAEKYYKDLAKSVGVSHLFEFVGAVPTKAVLQYYQNADVFAFPSVFETQGIAGIEAMTCGLPVIGARYLAIPDIVNDGKNGYLFSPRNPKDCARATLATLAHRKRLSRKSRQSVIKYSVSNTVGQLLALYRRAGKK